MFASGKKGQAAVEIAVFGSLILLLLGIILSYGQRLNSQQEAKMVAFRRAMRLSYEKNAPVTYTYKKDTRFIDPMGGLGQGSSAVSSSSANVMWTKGMGGLQGDDITQDQGVGLSHNYYQINDDIIKLPIHPKDGLSYGGDQIEVTVPVEVYDEDQEKKVTYGTTVNKAETPQEIVNERQSRLSERVVTTLHYRYDRSQGDPNPTQPVELPDYVYEGGNYTYAGEVINISRGGTYDKEAFLNPVQVDLDGDPGNGNEATVWELEYRNVTSPQDINVIERSRRWATEK